MVVIKMHLRRKMNCSLGPSFFKNSSTFWKKMVRKKQNERTIACEINNTNMLSVTPNE